MSDDRADVFERRSFAGDLSTGECEQPIEFTAYAGPDCRMIVDSLFVERDTYFSLMGTRGEPGSHSTPVSLHGESPDGCRFESDDMDLRGSNHNSDGFQVNLHAGLATIIQPRDRTKGEPTFALRYALRGFKSFRTKSVSTRSGMLEVAGPPKIESDDEVSGLLQVSTTESGSWDDWFCDAEELLNFVKRGLELAHGGALQIPLVQEYRDTEMEAFFYSGSGRPAHLPAINKLNQSDFIKALVDRHENGAPLPDDVWQAVGWLNSGTSVDEVRFLTLMVALETVLTSLVPERPSNLIKKNAFKGIRSALIDTLRSFKLSDEDTDILERNIMGINRAPLSRKLKAMIAKYNLSPTMFDGARLKLLNNQRGNIVHTGHQLEGEDLWECILYARELVVRIVLAELGYTGQFESYAGGHKQDRLAPSPSPLSDG